MNNQNNNYNGSPGNYGMPPYNNSGGQPPYGQPPYGQQPTYGGQMPAGAPLPVKKKKKIVPIIIAAVAAFLVIGGVVGFIVYQNSFYGTYSPTDDDVYEDFDADGGYDDQGTDEYGDSDAYGGGYDTSGFYQGMELYWGNYPQSLIMDVRTIAYLDDQSVDMDYTYVEAADDHGFTGTYTVSFGDFEYNGERYRKAIVNLDAEYENQTNGYYYFDSEHRYEVNHVYYFKWEPVEWTVRGIRDGEYILSSKYILDFLPVEWAESDWESSAIHSYIASEMEWDMFGGDVEALTPFDDGDSLSLFSLEEITDGHLGFTNEFDDFVRDVHYEDDDEKACEKTDYADFLSDGCYNFYVLRSYENGWIDRVNATYGDIDTMEDRRSCAKYGIRPIIKMAEN